jgi:hypothetical protein
LQYMLQVYFFNIFFNIFFRLRALMKEKFLSSYRCSTTSSYNCGTTSSYRCGTINIVLLLWDEQVFALKKAPSKGCSIIIFLINLRHFVVYSFLINFPT